MERRKALSGVTKLNLARVFRTLGSSTWEGAVEILGVMPGLLHLDLGYNHFGPDGAGTLAKGLENLTCLKDLCLSGNYFGPNGTANLVVVLEQMTKLQALQMGVNRLGVEGAELLMPVLGKMTSMQLLDLACNQFGPDGTRKLTPALNKMTMMHELRLGENELGPEGAEVLIDSLDKMPGMQRICLFQNQLGPHGARRLAGVLERMIFLETISLDVDQRDVQFDAIIPDEILVKGWKSVLAYLRELRVQGAEPVREVRVFLLGEGAQGKTSLRKALASPSGSTQKIDFDDRTVGIDIAVWDTGDFLVHFWDLSGQLVYRAVHSFTFGRGVVLLMYSPLDRQDANQVMKECIRPWLRMVHSLTPGASIMVICSHLESPNDDSDLSVWRKRVRSLAADVLEKVTEEITWLNEACAEEVRGLEEQLHDVQNLIDERYKDIRASLDRARQRRRIVDAALEDARLDPQMKTLRREHASIDNRLRLLQDRRTKKPKIMSLLEQNVICIDSVNGDGSSVTNLGRLLKEKLKLLPFLRQSVPKVWVQLLKNCDELRSHRIMPLEKALDAMGLADLNFNREQAMDALQFWDDLGRLKLHAGSVISTLVTDVPWLIDLLRPLLHHDIVGSLTKICFRRGNATASDLAVAGPRCKDIAPSERTFLLELAEQLKDYSVVGMEMLPYLSYWCELACEDSRRSALEILEQCALIARYSIVEGGKQEWVVTCRLKKPDQTHDLNLKVWTRNGPVLCYEAVYTMPPGLFSTLLAVQILRWRQAQTIVEVIKADSSLLHLQIKSVYSEKAQTVSALLVHDSCQEDRCCLYLRADTLPLLTILCCDWERIVREQFPGFMSTNTVLFHYGDRIYQCKVDQYKRMQHLGPGTIPGKSRSGLGYILGQRTVDVKVNAKSIEGDNVTMIYLLRRALDPPPFSSHPAIFLSHCKCDSSVRDDVATTVLDGLVAMVEAASGQAVRVNLEDSADEEGLRNARAIILLLSLPYLASSKCLLELGWALEVHLDRGKPLILVPVEEQLDEHMKRHIVNAVTAQDEYGMEHRVSVATLAVVRERLIITSETFYLEWVDGSGLATQTRWNAALRMVEKLWVMQDASLLGVERLQHGRFVVREEEGGWSLLHEIISH